MKLFTKKRTIIGLIAVVAVVAMAVGAYAYFTTTGSGVGSATVGTSSALTINQVGSVSNLLPNAPAQPIEYSIHNTSAGAQYVGPVTVSFTNADISGPSDTNSGPGTTCTTADFTLVQPTDTPGDIAPGATYTSSPSGASLRLIDTGANQDGCEGATVVLHFSA
jgi:hypothetical protein